MVFPELTRVRIDAAVDQGGYVKQVIGKFRKKAPGSPLVSLPELAMERRPLRSWERNVSSGNLPPQADSPPRPSPRLRINALFHLNRQGNSSSEDHLL